MAKKATIINFEWPEFSKDSERIKAYTKKYKDLSISEAFSKAYNLVLNDVSLEADMIPSELSVGDVISLKIINISKNRVDFDSANYKNSISCHTNLFKYDRFKKYLPTEPVKVRVVDVQKDKVTVDPISVLIDEWLSEVIKNPNVQKDMDNPQCITVKNLRLTKGGFTGDAVIPSVSEFVGEDYTMEAFIPGSQIVLNITDDFDQFIGQNVSAFVLNYINKPSSTNKQMSLICSTKEYLKFLGERILIGAFKGWCEENSFWEFISNNVYDGEVTGIINSSKKCGVFVEIPELKITGMVETKPEELVNYKPRNKVKVKLTGFEEEKKYNPLTKQMQHVEPYVITDNKLEKCNIKPILKFE